MRNNKIRRFRPRSGKHHSRRNGLNPKNNGIQTMFNKQSNFVRNNGTKNPHSLEKIIDKYNNLAKEALSIGDKTLSENYFQHSDHYSRILSEVNTYKTKEHQEDKSQTLETSKENIKNNLSS